MDVLLDQSLAPPGLILGERTALGPLRHELLAIYHRWHASLETQVFAGWPAPLQPVTMERAEQWYSSASIAEAARWFTIYRTDGLQPIGFVVLRDIDQQHKTAEIGITIGEASERGKGHGTEAMKLILDYAFTALGLGNVLLSVYEFNRGAVRAYEKAGFKVIGRRRKSHFAAGSMWDVIFMDCIAGEFRSPALVEALGVRAPSP